MKKAKCYEKSFRYTPAIDTDISKTIKREMDRLKKLEESKVKQFPERKKA